MRKRQLEVMLLILTSVACQHQQFKGSANTRSGEQGATPGGQPYNPGQVPPSGPNTATQTSTDITGVPPLPGGFAPTPDYEQCAGMTNLGLQNGGICSPDHVVVIINDGSAGGISCCPVGPLLLSSGTGARNVLRTGACLNDEVATGMKDMKASEVYCSTINTSYFKATLVGQSKLMRGKNSGNAAMDKLVASYNLGDCCACDAGTIVAGRHSGTNDQCTDQCVRIDRK